MSRTMIAEERMEKFDLYPEPRSTGILRFCVLMLIMAASTLSVIAQSSSGVAQLNLDVTRIVSPISPTLYGLMTEEINHSYDGGLYAEMIQNRAFHSDWEHATVGSGATRQRSRQQISRYVQRTK